MKIRNSRKLALAATLFSLVFVTSDAIAKKPIDAPPGEAQLLGSVLADDGSGGAMGTFDVGVRSGKETTAFIVVRGFVFRAIFAEDVDFFEGKFGPNDGGNCFGAEPYPHASGAYTLYEDGSAEFNVYPEFLTADAEAIQKYHFYLTGEHGIGPPDKFGEEFLKLWSAGDPIEVTFNNVEITTEGKGQNRRRSCTGVFPDPDKKVEFSATAWLYGLE